MVNQHESVCSCKWLWPAEGRDWLLVVLGSSAGGLLASTKIVRSLELNKHGERETHLMHSETRFSCPVGFTPTCSEAFSETSGPVPSPGVPHVQSSWGSTLMSGTCASSWGRVALDKEGTAVVAMSVTLDLFLPRHQKGDRP